MGPHVLARVRPDTQGRGAVSICGSAAWAHRRGTPRPDLSTRTQVTPSAKPHAGDMLWSDPENEPPKELRDTQDMLRRLSVFLALAMVLAMVVLGLG